jgi:hypothetical protein
MLDASSEGNDMPSQTPPDRRAFQGPEFEARTPPDDPRPSSRRETNSARATLVAVVALAAIIALVVLL